MNLFNYGIGGIYKIQCEQTKRVYIGQTYSFLYRANNHLEQLRNQQHECSQLQLDFNFYGESAFIFEILCIEADEIKRLELEKDAIIQHYGTNSEVLLYNSKKPTGFNLNARIAQRIQIHGQVFPSIMAAVRNTRESKTSIIRKLNDPTNLSYVRLDQINLGKYQVHIDNSIYESTSEVVTAGLAKTTSQVRRRCRSQSKHWSNWILKDRSNDYPIRE